MKKVTAQAKRPLVVYLLVWLLAPLAYLMSLSGCVSYPDKINLSFDDVAYRVLKEKPSLRQFMHAGPFETIEKTNLKLRLARSETISFDYFMSNQIQPAPLLVFQHGNKADKSVHRNQAMRAASWGLNAIVVDQPNTDEWEENGHRLADLLKLLYRAPKLLYHSFDRNRIILIGHSFGASAAAIAASKNAPISGLIFLDPALYDPSVKSNIARIEVPTVILGADPEVFKSKNRRVFFQLPKSDLVEVSIAGATHNDAQYPNMFDWSHLFGLKKSPTKYHQEVFTGSILASAFSFASLGSYTYAWQAFKNDSIAFKDIKRK